MKKLCTILILVLAISTCLTSCDLLSSIGSGNGSKSTTDAATEGSELSTEAAPETEQVVVTDDEGNAVTDEAGNVMTEIVTVAPQEPDENAPDTDGVNENPDTDPEIGNTVVAPTEKTPFAWFDAAYKTFASMTNGTLRFEMTAESGSYTHNNFALVKISNGTYAVEMDSDVAVYVDGYAYSVSEKVKLPMSAEDFCEETFPYYPLTTALFPLTEKNFENVDFTVSDDGTHTFVITLTAEEFNELMGEETSETMKEMVYTVAFASNGTFKKADAVASFGYVDEETGEEFNSSSALTVELFDLGITPVLTVPEDADDYVLDDYENNVVATVPAMTDKNNAEAHPDEIDPDANGKNPNEDIPSKDSSVSDKEDKVEEDDKLYEKELELGKDLNGDGVIGRPDAAKEESTMPGSLDYVTTVPNEKEEEKNDYFDDKTEIETFVISIKP